MTEQPIRLTGPADLAAAIPQRARLSAQVMKLACFGCFPGSSGAVDS
jgi:hypothetical protein